MSENRETRYCGVNKIAILILCGLSVSMSGAAFSNENSDAENTASVEELMALSLDDLFDIEITMMKRGDAQKLIDIPLSISAFSGQWFEENNHTSIQDALDYVPGGSAYSTSPGVVTAQLRGISAGGGDSASGLYLDNVPIHTLGFQFTPTFNSFDVANVEVLRGPLGSLYGAGSQTGLIRVSTRDPEFNHSDSKVQVVTDTIKGGEVGQQFNAILNIPLSEDNTALRVVGGLSEIGGYIDNVQTGESDTNSTTMTHLRAKLLTQVSDQLSVKLSSWHSRSNADGSLWETGSNQTDTPSFFRESTLIENENYDLVFEYDLGRYQLFSSTSVSYANFEQVDANISSATKTEFDQRSLNTELRLKFDGGDSWQWLWGINFIDIEQTLDSLLLRPPPNPSVPFLSEKDRSKRVATFGEATHHFWNDSANITLGVRYFRDDREKIERLQSVLDVFSTAGLSPSRGGTFSDVSPRLSVSWKRRNSTMYFFNIGKGFKSGLVQFGLVDLVKLQFPQFEAPSQIDPETLWSFELGTKQSLVDGLLNMELSLYYWRWNNLQSTKAFLDPSTGSFLTLFVDDAGDADSLGFEFNLTYFISKKFHWRLSGTVSSPEYNDDALSLGIQAGMQINNVFDNTFHTSLSYQFDVAGSLHSRFNIEANYRSERFVYTPNLIDPTSPTSSRSDPMTRLNINYSLSKPEHWNASVFVKNALNEEGNVIPVQQDLTRIVAKPLTLGIRFTLSF